MYIYDELKSFETGGGKIKVGIVGAGFMGQGIVEVMESAPGMEVAAISDIDIDRAAACYESVDFKNYSEIKNAHEAVKIDLSKRRVICSDFRIIPEIEQLDFIIEATGVPEVGAQTAFFSIMNKKHVGMMNVEADITVGYYLNMLAKRSGVVYTVCTGDEPAAIKELHDFVKTLGFKVVACGKGKNNPLDVNATPETLGSRAKESGLNPRLLTEFVDGSKTMVEMSCAANATGLTIDKRNMHGANVNVDQLSKVFTIKDRGGLLSSEGVIDYAIGDVAPGVFLVARHEGKIVNSTLRYLKLGEGPDYLFYRPYHLTSIEVPVSVAAGFLHQKSVVSTASPPTTEVITIAKKDLEKGGQIDCLGGFTVYAGIEKTDNARHDNLLPFGLCEGAALKTDIKKGSPITYENVKLKDNLLLSFRKIQDRMID